MDPLGIYVGIATLFVTIIMAAVKTTAAVAKHEKTILSVMANHEIKDMERFAEVEVKLAEVADRARRDFGETALALRQKMTDMELWGRDNYVRKDSVWKQIEELKEMINQSNHRRS